MIDKFEGQHRFLSNFFPIAIWYEGIKYPSVEHAYQAIKTFDIPTRKRIAGLTAGGAKKAGKNVQLRPDWEDIKLEIMENLLNQKFVPGGWFADELKATVPHELVEGNYWGDTFWGVCRGKGENHLGKLLMKIRDTL